MLGMHIPMFMDHDLCSTRVSQLIGRVWSGLSSKALNWIAFQTNLPQPWFGEGFRWQDTSAGLEVF